METIIVASGYFDPIHKGHIEYLNKSKKLGDKLIVIVNNNQQALYKKGKFFMDEKERKIVLENIKCVDEVIISIDEDRSVCRTLNHIFEMNSNNKIIFTNGGDVTNNKCREFDLCQSLGIEMIDGLGDKIQSSSNLTKDL